MRKLKAKCRECGKEGEVVTVLAESDKTDVTEDFVCYPCWKAKNGYTGNTPRSVSVGWLKE